MYFFDIFNERTLTHSCYAQRFFVVFKPIIGQIYVIIGIYNIHTNTRTQVNFLSVK